MEVRTRMAPSPTGEYHIGHIRTVLYNYAFTRKHDGDFLIRIEDTDRERFVEGATERILSIIKDYGLDWDEGPQKGGEHGPYIQSERLEIYKDHANELVEKDAAYHCFCSKERLQELRKEQKKEGLPVTKYDKKCLRLSKKEVQEKLAGGEPYVIRLNVPEDREITFYDHVYGEITINTKDVDDQILLKSDGYPSYHLAVVVDDHLMNITHIMRGNDWIPSTPKHVLLYEAFGWEPPKFVHLPNLKEKGGDKKLSKRFGAVYAVDFLRQGYLSEALLNFLMFLGWNPGTEKEIYTLDEFIKDFSIDRVHNTDLVAFDRDKLLWINGFYIRELEVDVLYKKIIDWKEKFKAELPEEFLNEDGGKKILSLIQERLKKFDEIPELTYYFYNEPEVEKELLVSYTKDKERSKEILNSFIELFEGLDEWEAGLLHDKSFEMLKKNDYSPKEGFMSVRVAVSGVKATPPIEDTLKMLGRKSTINRLKAAINVIDS